MTRYLLDTNIVSNIVKPEPSQSLLAWMGGQKDDDLFIASLTIAEIQRGILEKPPGKKRAALDAWFAGPDGPQALLPARNQKAATRRTSRSHVRRASPWLFHHGRRERIARRF